MHYRIYRRKSGTYYLDVYLDGARHRRSLATRNKREAHKQADDVLAAIAGHVPVAGRVRLDAALEQITEAKQNAATRRSYRAKARTVCRIVGSDTNLLELGRGDVERYISVRRGEGMVDHTIHKELTILRQAWRRLLPAAPCPVPAFSAAYRPRKRWLPTDEAVRLLAACGRSHARTWLMLALYAGAEVGAIRRLKWPHVDLAAGVIRLPGTKRETRDRNVPIVAELREYLETLDPARPLVGGWSNRYRDLRKWCTAAKIDPVTMTDLRRTFGSWLKQAGVDSARVAALMGHSSTAMVDRVYGQLNADSLRDAIEHLPRLTRRLTAI